MYGTCETLCRELAAQYPGDTPLMLVIWSPEEIQTAEQALWKREWAARDNGLAVPECVTRRQAMVNQARSLLKNNTHGND